MSVENLKFNVSDINDILLYIQQRYPNLLVSANTEHAEFENGDKIYFVGNQVLETIDRDVIIDPETNKIIDKKNPNSSIKQQRFEFLFDFILTKIHEVNPEDNLTKTKKSIPYISLYMSGLKIPLIVYAWYQYGLLTALNRFSIDYEISDVRGEPGDIVIELKNKKFLILRPETVRDRLIVNGLLVNKLKYQIQDLDSREEIVQFITDTYGKMCAYRIKKKYT